MKIEVEPTGRFTDVDGVRCRIWKGRTDKGVEVEMFVPLVQAKADVDQEEFRRELSETKVDRQLVYFDHRLL